MNRWRRVHGTINTSVGLGDLFILLAIGLVVLLSGCVPTQEEVRERTKDPAYVWTRDGYYLYSFCYGSDRVYVLTTPHAYAGPGLSVVEGARGCIK